MTPTAIGKPLQVALVVGGGAVKAYAFHLGVVRGLEEDGFTFASGVRWRPRAADPGQRPINQYVGSSAGACVVASLASGHTSEAMSRAVLGTSREVPRFGYRTLFVPVAPNPKRYLRRLHRRWKLGRLRPHHLLETSGLLSTAGVERYFRRYGLATNRFADLSVPLFIVATQVNSSRKVVFGPFDSLEAPSSGALEGALAAGYDAGCAYYDNVPISQAIAAAVAVPPLFAPYRVVNPSSGTPIDYYDGEVRETLSLHVARDAGADFAIASSIWQPLSYDQRLGSVADLGLSALVEQALHQSVGEKVEQDRLRAERYDRVLALLQTRGEQAGLAAADIQRLQAEVCRLLHHRPVRTLYVTPEPGETQFFLDSSFSFSRSLLTRCMEAGHRAYRAALQGDPDFLPALDRSLAARGRAQEQEPAPGRPDSDRRQWRPAWMDQ